MSKLAYAKLEVAINANDAPLVTEQAFRAIKQLAQVWNCSEDRAQCDIEIEQQVGSVKLTLWRDAA